VTEAVRHPRQQCRRIPAAHGLGSNIPDSAPVFAAVHSGRFHDISAYMRRQDVLAGTLVNIRP
jgi:hypothetical protein